MRIYSVKEIANTIRGRRLEQGLSQTELAQAVDVSRKWLSDFETGKARVDIATLMRILEALSLELNIDKLERKSPSPDRRQKPDLDQVLEEYRTRP